MVRCSPSPRALPILHLQCCAACSALGTESDPPTPELWFSTATPLCSAVKASTVADTRWHGLSRRCCRSHQGRPRLGRHQALRHACPVHPGGRLLCGSPSHDVPWLQPHCRGCAAQLQGDQASELLGCAPDLSSHGSCGLAAAPGLAIVTDGYCLGLQGYGLAPFPDAVAVAQPEVGGVLLGCQLHVSLGCWCKMSTEQQQMLAATLQCSVPPGPLPCVSVNWLI